MSSRRLRRQDGSGAGQGVAPGRGEEAAVVAQRTARAIHRQLGATKIEQVFQSGLHEFITTFIADNNRVGSAISAQYLV